MVDDFQDLMLRQHELSTIGGKIGNFDLLAARDHINLLSDQDSIVDAQLRRSDPSVDNELQRLQTAYGADYLKALTDRELYQLYKSHALAK